MLLHLTRGLCGFGGVHEKLLSALRDQGVPSALVTMSWRSLADAVVGALPDGTFAAVVTGDEVSHGKPHPEPYRAAARLLGVSAEDCVAIEDSPTGVRSAVAAGVPTLAVPHVVAVPEIAGAVHLDTLSGLTPAALADLARDAPERPSTVPISPTVRPALARIDSAR